MENNRKSKANESLGILMRVIKYMVTNYKLAFLGVLACIILSAAATARGMLFIQSLVDDYIQPLLAQAAGMQAAGGQGAVGGQAAAAQAGFHSAVHGAVRTGSSLPGQYPGILCL